MSARSLRSKLGAATRRVRGSRAATVDVVVVVEPVDRPRLAAALRSIDEQAYPEATVRVCPLTDAEPTWQAAANAGVAAARADFVVLLRGCDLLAPGALWRGAQALAASDAPVCSGRLEQAGEPEPWLSRAQHEPLRLSLAGTMLRRSAWVGIDPDDEWLLSTTVARLLAEGGRDLRLEDPAATWFPDHGTRAYGATPSPLPGLAGRRDRLAVLESLLDRSSLASSWQRLVAGVEVPRLLQDAERADDAQWTELCELARSISGRPGWAAGVGAAARALVWLAAHDRRADLELVATEVPPLGDGLRAERLGAEVQVHWPVSDLPDEIVRLSVAETGLTIDVVRTRADGADLRLAVDHVDLADPSTRVTVRDAAGADHEVRALASALRPRDRRFQAARDVQVVATGELTVTVEQGDLVRTARVAVPGPTRPQPGPVTVTDASVDGGSLRIAATGALDGLLLLGRADLPLPGQVLPGADGAEIALVADSFGVLLPLPPGSHRLVAGDQNVAVAEPLRSRLPLVLHGGQHRIVLHLGPRGGLVLELGAPLADDEVGPYAQQRLQTAYAATERPVDPDLFYFESYAGRSATDSPRAIFEELRRRRPDVRALWGVADSGQRVPDGARPVLLRSQEWYDALATAGVLVLNTDTEVWFRRRPGQVLLQTFHGYPSKAMGRSQWEANDYRPSRVRELRARGVDTWSAILTPTPEMTRHYREQYDYDGPAFEHGYPRDDDLTGPDAGTRRDATRARLEIAAGQTAVLYAPTWRDHLASRPRAAEMTEYLDIAQAAEALGPDHVLLLRGHRFHSPARVSGAARVVDVTSYPEINDLILAADVAVLDYSSLRFDFALTGRPMVFLVPDVEEYAAGSRRFLFPFEESAPGPFVDDTTGVVRELRYPGLAERWAGPIAAFNATYHPWQDGRASARVVDALLALRDQVR